MREMTERLRSDPRLREAYLAAHRDYAARRDAAAAASGVEPLAAGRRNRRRHARPGQVPARAGRARACGAWREPARPRGHTGAMGQWWAAGPCVERSGREAPAGGLMASSGDTAGRRDRLRHELAAAADRRHRRGRHRLVDVQRGWRSSRLGQGVDATGRLAPDALARTFAMLEQYAEAIGESGAGAVRLVATSATRDASNADEFTAGVRRILGIDPEVISGAEEAYLSFSGATAELAGREASGRARPARAAVPRGGHRRRLDRVRARRAPGLAADDLAAISIDIGCVRLTERHLHDDPPTRAQIAAATADIDAALATVADAVPAGRGEDARRAGRVGHHGDRARARAGQPTTRRDPSRADQRRPRARGHGQPARHGPRGAGRQRGDPSWPGRRDRAPAR